MQRISSQIFGMLVLSFDAIVAYCQTSVLNLSESAAAISCYFSCKEAILS